MRVIINVYRWPIKGKEDNMIDAVTLSLPTSHVDKSWNKRIFSTFGKVKQWDTNTYEAYLDNITVLISRERILLRGSLAKYWHGNNITTFTREEVYKAIKRLENETGLYLGAAEVTSLEIGFCVQLTHDVNTYLRRFSYARRYDFHKFGRPTGISGIELKENGLETAGYGTNTGGIKFLCYDKTKEVQSSRRGIPEEFRDKNVMRLEYKLKRSSIIQAKFGRDLFAPDLFDPDIYQRLQDLFYEFYKGIPKMGRKLRTESLDDLRPERFKYPKGEYEAAEDDLDNLQPMMLTPARAMQFWAYHQRHLHPEEFFEVLQELVENGIINAKTFSTVKTNCWKEDLDYKPSEVYDIIFELDLKVRRALAGERKCTPPETQSPEKLVAQALQA
jgi:hypothetical protein